MISAVGGAGATTLAIEMATRLATCAPRAMVGLIDLNLADGAAAAYLGGKPVMNLTEASAALDRMDAALLGAFASRVGGGFDLFASPRDPAAFSRYSPAAICRLLEVACQTYDWLVVDMPRIRQPWTIDVLAGSDEVLIVSELTVPALLAARALADEIEAELGEEVRPKILLNRIAKRAFGPGPRAPRRKRRCAARSTRRSPRTGRPRPVRPIWAGRSATTARVPRSCATWPSWSTAWRRSAPRCSTLPDPARRIA